MTVERRPKGAQRGVLFFITYAVRTHIYSLSHEIGCSSVSACFRHICGQFRFSEYFEDLTDLPVARQGGQREGLS